MRKRILTLTLALSMSLLFGCLDSQVKVSPEQNIKNILVKLQQDYANEDVDGIMTAYSEDYAGPQGEGKAQVEEFLSAIKDQGYLADTEVVLDNVVIEVDDETATAVPIRYTGSWGQADYKATFKKEDSTWRIITGEQSN